MSTRAQLLAEIAAQFPDNTTGLITPAKLRQVVEDVTNSCLVSETDAGTAGIAVLQAETPAQAREAIGVGVLTANAQSGSYVLAAGDVTGSTEIRQTSASGVNLTINAGTYPLNTPVFGKQLGAGQVTFVAGSGVTLRIPNSATKTAYQYSAWAAVQVSENVWEITGSLS